MQKELELYTFCPHCGKELFLETIENQQVKKCHNCDFIFWNNLKPVVSILVHKDGKVLMLQRAKEPLKGFWVLPGGFLGQETAEEGIQREAKEEIGQEVILERILGTYLIDNDPRGMHLDIIFVGTIEEEIQISNEHVAYKYIDPANLPEHIAFKHRQAIEEWSKSVL